MASTKKGQIQWEQQSMFAKKRVKYYKSTASPKWCGRRRGLQLNVQLVFLILLKGYGIKVLKKHKMVQEEGGGLDSNLMSSLSSLYGRQVNLARVHWGLHYTTNIESKERNSVHTKLVDICIVFCTLSNLKYSVVLYIVSCLSWSIHLCCILPPSAGSRSSLSRVF